MKESALYNRFSKKMLQYDKDAFVYKIPDTGPLGGKKPFDTICITQGVAFAIEFKLKKNDVTKYQNYQLDKFKNAGGYSITYINGISTIESLVDVIIFVRDQHLKSNLLARVNLN